MILSDPVYESPTASIARRFLPRSPPTRGTGVVPKPGSGRELFDLVIATNMFIYYNVLDQALAMSNIEAILRPGAFLLANVSAPDLTSLTIRPVDTTTTLYGRARQEDVYDFIVWYQAHAN